MSQHKKYDTSKVKTITLNGKKYIDMSVIEDIRTEIKNIPITEERDWATYWNCRDDVIEIIDRKVNEVTDENDISASNT